MLGWHTGTSFSRSGHMPQHSGKVCDNKYQTEDNIMAGVKSKPLISLKWNGGHKKLWSMLDLKGNPAKSGTPIASFDTLNKKGRKAGDIIDVLESQRYVCREDIREIEAETKRISGKCLTVEKVLKASSNKQNEILGEYRKASDNAKDAGLMIKAAQQDLETALQGLENAENKLKHSKSEEQLKKYKDKFDALKKERDKTIASIKEILKVAKVVRGKSLVAMAEMAIGKIAVNVVEVDYKPKLAALKQKIGQQAKISAELDKAIVKGEVAKAVSELKTQIAELEAQQGILNSSIRDASRMRVAAINRLNQHSSTVGLAKIMKDRTLHVKRIELARKNIAAYKSGLEVAKRDLTSLGKSYGSVKDVLKAAEKKEKSYAPDSAYGKTACKWGLDNNVALGFWSTYAVSEIKNCKKHGDYLADKGDNGPLAGYNKLETWIDQALDQDRTTLRKNGLKC